MMKKKGDNDANYYASSSMLYYNRKQLSRFFHTEEKNFGVAVKNSVLYGWNELATRCVLTLSRRFL